MECAPFFAKFPDNPVPISPYIIYAYANVSKYLCVCKYGAWKIFFSGMVEKNLSLARVLVGSGRIRIKVTSIENKMSYLQWESLEFFVLK